MADKDKWVIRHCVSGKTELVDTARMNELLSTTATVFSVDPWPACHLGYHDALVIGKDQKGCRACGATWVEEE